MRPRADEVLRSVIWTYDTYLAPQVEEPLARSLSLTVGNLLRHVLVRVEREGAILFEDNRALRELLDSIRAFLRSPAAVDAAVGGPDLLDEIDGVLAGEYHGPDVYPSLALLAEEAADLRGAADRALRALRAARPALGDDEDYRATRAAIRVYLRDHLLREMPLVAEAFTGDRR